MAGAGAQLVSEITPRDAMATNALLRLTKDAFDSTQSTQQPLERVVQPVITEMAERYAAYLMGGVKMLTWELCAKEMESVTMRTAMLAGGLGRVTGSPAVATMTQAEKAAAKTRRRRRQSWRGRRGARDGGRRIERGAATEVEWLPSAEFAQLPTAEKDAKRVATGVAGEEGCHQGGGGR